MSVDDVWVRVARRRDTGWWGEEPWPRVIGTASTLPDTTYDGLNCMFVGTAGSGRRDQGNARCNGYPWVRTCLNPSSAAMRKSGVAVQSTTVDGGYGVLLYASW